MAQFRDVCSAMRKWFAEAPGTSFSDMMSSLAALREALPQARPQALPPCPRPCHLRHVRKHQPSTRRAVSAPPLRIRATTGSVASERCCSEPPARSRTCEAEAVRLGMHVLDRQTAGTDLVKSARNSCKAQIRVTSRARGVPAASGTSRAQIVVTQPATSGGPLCRPLLVPCADVRGAQASPQSSFALCSRPLPVAEPAHQPTCSSLPSQQVDMFAAIPASTPPRRSTALKELPFSVAKTAPLQFHSSPDIASVAMAQAMDAASSASDAIAQAIGASLGHPACGKRQQELPKINSAICIPDDGLRRTSARDAEQRCRLWN